MYVFCCYIRMSLLFATIFTKFAFNDYLFYGKCIEVLISQVLEPLFVSNF